MKQIGVDVGGTFTDVFLVGDAGEAVVHKIPSTPDDPSVATVDGMRGACERAGVEISSLDMVFHGSTVATNAVLQRAGAKVGLITTEGFRDVLHIARHKRPLNFSLYQELPWQKHPLVPRHLRLTVAERIEPPEGEVKTALDEGDVKAAIERFKEEGVESVAVCFLHSYLNPDHERRVGEILAAELPDVFVSLRHRVTPEYREYESFNTVAMNAYLGPVTSAYMERLATRVRDTGIEGEIHFMTSTGGVESTEAVARKPVNMLLSGPVAGVLGGMAAGGSAGFENVITFDVGGTSADIGVIHENQVRHKHWLDNEVGGFALRTSMVDISTIGAGGGSIAYVDRGGMLQVGPRSAGAQPGPACYDLGGEDATVTDAQLVLGRLTEDSFLGGRMEISRERAEEAIRERIAEPLGMSIEEAAAGIVRIATAHMTQAIELNSVRKGFDPREFALVAFGGAGPVFAPDIAAELEIPDIVAPRYPGISSAIGLLGSDMVHDFRGTIVALLGGLEHEEVEKRFAEMEDQAREQLARDGFAGGDTTVTRYVECRYAGQGYEIRYDAPTGRVDADWVDAARQGFHRVHEREYAHAFEDSEVEIVNIGVEGVGKIPEVKPPELGTANGKPPKPSSEREVWFEAAHAMVKSAVYSRASLLAGHLISGPAVIEQEDSTVLIPVDQTGRVDQAGNIVISRGAA